MPRRRERKWGSFSLLWEAMCLVRRSARCHSPSWSTSIGVGIALRRFDEGNDLRDHPTATHHVERFTCCHPVEVVRGAVAELPQTDSLHRPSLPHPVTSLTKIAHQTYRKGSASAQPCRQSSSSLPALSLEDNSILDKIASVPSPTSRHDFNGQ